MPSFIYIVLIAIYVKRKKIKKNYFIVDSYSNDCYISINVNQPMEKKMTDKIKSFKIYTDDTDEDKVLVGDDVETALEILENNGYIVEVEYKDEQLGDNINNNTGHCSLGNDLCIHNNNTILKEVANGRVYK